MKGRVQGPGLRHAALAAYFVVCLLAMIWPAYAWLGGGIEPYVLGFPRSLAWVVGWVLITFVVLVVYYFADDRARRDDEG